MYVMIEMHCFRCTGTNSIQL